MLSDQFQEVWNDGGVLAQFISGQVRYLQLQRNSVKVGLGRNDEANHVTLAGVPTDADVLDGGMGLQEALHFAKTDVLTALKLHEVLLPVDDLHGPVRHHLPDVASLEPSLAVLIE